MGLLRKTVIILLLCAYVGLFHFFSFLYHRGFIIQPDQRPSCL